MKQRATAGAHVRRRAQGRAVDRRTAARPIRGRIGSTRLSATGRGRRAGSRALPSPARLITPRQWRSRHCPPGKPAQVRYGAWRVQSARRRIIRSAASDEGWRCLGITAPKPRARADRQAEAKSEALTASAPVAGWHITDVVHFVKVFPNPCPNPTRRPALDAGPRFRLALRLRKAAGPRVKHGATAERGWEADAQLPSHH